MSDWNSKPLYDRIVDRWVEKDADYSKINNNRDIMATYFRSDELVDTDEKGNLLGQAIYNGHGSWFSRMMATGFQGSLVSKNIEWFRYMLRQLELRGIDELDIWLQDIEEYMIDVYQTSNFYDVQPTFTHDGLTLGSPVMFAEEDLIEQKTMWMPQHYKTVRVYYDKFNRENGVIVRDKTWTAKQIFDTFVKTDDQNYTKAEKKLSLSVTTALRAGLLNDVFTVYRATFKANDQIWNAEGDKKFTKPSGQWKWLSAYFLELTNAEGNKKNTPLNDNMGDFSQPFTIWNFDKKPWEASSRTPAWYALWDNLSLQQIDKNYLEDIQNTNRPASISVNSMKGRVDLGPEGQMYVTNAEYDRPTKFIDRVGGLQFSKDLMDIKVEALKRWFYIDQFQMFSDLALQKNQPVSAQQIWRMAGEKSTLLSPAIETHSRYLETADARMIDIEVRAGRGPFDKQRLDNITDIILSNITKPISTISIRPIFIGPLAQAQRVDQALKPIEQTMDVMLPLMDRIPELRNRYRWYELGGKIDDAFGFPQDVVVPKEEYDERVKAQAEALAQQQQLGNAVEMAKASKDVSGAVDPKSILATVAGGGE